MAQPEPGDPAVPPANDPRWADLADLVLVIGREIQFRGYADEAAIPLSQSEGVVMRYLNKDPAAPPSRIAAATGLQRTNLSAILQGLERKSLVERRVSPDDRRGVTVHPTERGTSNYALVRQEWASALSAAADGDAGSLDAVLRLLHAVEAGLVDSRPASPGRPPALM